MMYRLNVFNLLHSFNDHIYQLKIAERVTNIWKSTLLFTLCSIVIYSWLGYFGIGSHLILENQYQFSAEIYESNKFWFIIGRAFFGLLFSIVIIFLPALIFKWLFNDVQFYKLVAMQLAVLVILLIERLTWIPLITFFSLDSFVSPFSLGVIASYITSKSWIIYFFGSISLFQLFVIVLQIKCLTKLLNASKWAIYSTVIFLQFIQSWFVAVITFISPYLIEGWF